MELNCVNVWKTNKKAAVWAVLTLVLNLILTGGFVVWFRKLALKSCSPEE